jgi:hypothetical protein
MVWTVCITLYGVQRTEDQDRVIDEVCAECRDRHFKGEDPNNLTEEAVMETIRERAGPHEQELV